MNFSKLKFDIDKGGISIRELCRRIGMSNTGLHRSIQNETINVNSFERICKELRLNPNDYFELGFELPEHKDTFMDKLNQVENLIKQLQLDLQQNTNSDQNDK